MSSKTSLSYLLPWSSSVTHLAKLKVILLRMSCECQMLSVKFQLCALQLLSAWQYIELNWLNGHVACWIRLVNIVLRQAKAQCFSVVGNLAAVLFRKIFQQFQPIMKMVLIILKPCHKIYIIFHVFFCFFCKCNLLLYTVYLYLKCLMLVWVWVNLIWSKGTNIHY